MMLMFLVAAILVEASVETLIIAYQFDDPYRQDDRLAHHHRRTCCLERACQNVLLVHRSCLRISTALSSLSPSRNFAACLRVHASSLHRFEQNWRGVLLQPCGNGSSPALHSGFWQVSESFINASC